MRVLTLLLLLAGAPALAQPYLTPAQVDLVALLPPPPAPGSPDAEADMAAVLYVQSTRTPEQAAQTVHDAVETVFVQFTETLGPAFTAATLPRVAALFERLGETEGAVVDPAKQAFGRKRPFLANADVHPSLPLSSSGSWPSGHATRVTLAAIVLAKMLPEQRRAIFDRAQGYAWNRVVSGLHYPSDVLAGGRSGTAIAAVLLQDAAFQAAYAPARAELRAALHLPD